MTPYRKAELEKLIVPGSQVEPMRARCLSCEANVDHGELLEGKCEKCVAKARGEDMSQSTLRKKVFDRDRGHCGACGIDCSLIRKELDGLKTLSESSGTVEARHYWQARIYFYSKLYGFEKEDLESGRELWDCDHVVPRAAQGASSLSNARTLCRPCHQKVTGKFNSDRFSGKRRRFGR